MGEHKLFFIIGQMAEGCRRAGALIRLVHLVKLVQLKPRPEGGSVLLNPIIDRMQDFRVFRR